MLSPIFASFNQDRSRSGQTDLCINMYPESNGGATDGDLDLLISTPGLTTPLVVVGTGPIRGQYRASNNKMYVVSGNKFYVVDTSYNATLIGTIGSSTGPVKMIDNPTQILVVDSTGGWCTIKATNVFTSVIPNADTSNTNPNSAAYQDGFGIVNSGGTNVVYQSNYNDLSTFATLNGGGLGSTANNAFIQGNPQDVVTLFDLKREVWIFKKDAVEVWVNQGVSGFSFVQLQGVNIPVGCAAAASVAKVDDCLMWLGEGEEGSGVVYMSVGYQAKPVTPPALAAKFQQYGTTSDAIAYSYQGDGHFFYVITFPTANASWCYDKITGKWHQRAYFYNGQFTRERQNCYCYFNGKRLAGDYVNGNIYAMDDNTYTDNGAVRKWLRSWRALIPSEPKGIEISFDELQILMETGITTPDGSDPQLVLRWSDDGGYTWLAERLVPAGKVGETAWRVISRAMGSIKQGTGMDRIWEISGTDPMRIKITGASWEGGPE